VVASPVSRLSSGASLGTGVRVDHSVVAAGLDSASDDRAHVVRLRGAGLHECGARKNQGLAAPSMLVAIKILGVAHLLANGDAGGMLCSGRFSPGRSSTGSPSRNAAIWARSGLNHSPAPMRRALGVGTLAYVAMIFCIPSSSSARFRRGEAVEPSCAQTINRTKILAGPVRRTA